MSETLSAEEALDDRTSAETLHDLASASENGHASLYYSKLSEKQKFVIRTVLGNTWPRIGESYEHGQFTIRILGTTTERFISIIEEFPEPIEN